VEFVGWLLGKTAYYIAWGMLLSFLLLMVLIPLLIGRISDSWWDRLLEYATATCIYTIKWGLVLLLILFVILAIISTTVKGGS